MRLGFALWFEGLLRVAVGSDGFLGGLDDVYVQAPKERIVYLRQDDQN